MKVLKTIVATAVIVFALTSVAMAGVQHFTKAQSAQAAGKAPVRYTVTLTAQQRTGTHARRAHRQHSAAHQAQHQAHAQHAYRSGSSGQGVSSGQSGSHHYEPSHHTYASGNGHSGDYGDGGGQCGD
jgi:Ca2+/H+ antiporter